MSPLITNDGTAIDETKDINANAVHYTSATGEMVTQFGLAIGGAGGRFPVGASNATVPATASVVYTNASVAASGIVLTIPAASAVTPGRLILFKDEFGGATSSNTITVETPVGGGKIDATAAGSPLVVINAAYGSWKMYSDGTNWHVW